MKYNTLVVAALATFANAHSGPRDVHAPPKVLGGRKFLAELRAENGFPAPMRFEKREPIQVVENPRLEERQISTTGQCGPSFGHCPAGQCCSLEG